MADILGGFNTQTYTSGPRKRGLAKRGLALVFSETDFCHQSGRHWPDLDDTLGFESYVLGLHVGADSGPPRGRERAQNVAPGTGFRTPKYRPNPANGGPIGGKNAF